MDSNNYNSINLSPSLVTPQEISDLIVNLSEPTGELTTNCYNLTNDSSAVDHIEPSMYLNSWQFTDQQGDQFDYIKESTDYPYDLIETVNYHHHHHHHQQQQQSDYVQQHLNLTSSDYRPTLELTTSNVDYVNIYNLLPTGRPTSCPLSYSESLTTTPTIPTISSSTLTSSLPLIPPSISTTTTTPTPTPTPISSNINLNHQTNQYNPSALILNQPTGLIEPSSSPYETMVTIDYDYNQFNHSPSNLLTISSTQSINSQQSTETPSTGYYYYRPLASLSSDSSSCSTSTSSLYPPSSSSSSSSLVDKGDYPFTIDDGHLSSGSSISSSSSSSSSSRLPRKRSVDYLHRHRTKNSKKEKLDQMMSEDKRLEFENDLLREQIRVMEHQFKVLQTKITNILIDAAKKSS